MLRAGSADTMIARRRSCIPRSTRTFFRPRRRRPASIPRRVGARALQARGAGDRGLRPGRCPAADRRRRARTARGWSAGRPSVHVPRPGAGRGRARRVPGGRGRSILAGEEDFGMVPVEAQACGRPVVALRPRRRARNRPRRRHGPAVRRADGGIAGGGHRQTGQPCRSSRHGSAPTPSVLAAAAHRGMRAVVGRDVGEAGRGRGGKALQPPARRVLRRHRRAAGDVGVRAGLRHPVRERPHPGHQGLPADRAVPAASCRSSPC